MSAFVLVAAQKPDTAPEQFDALALTGRVTARLPLRVTYFGCPVQVWEMESSGDANAQCDRFASGWFTALQFDTLQGVQRRVNEWQVFSQV